ncbi:MAG: dihydroneopterin aldolase [Campylobacterota bacterium]|nr:dihydroneopterin aldolase [Campylobacterota bacterium]
MHSNKKIFKKLEVNISDLTFKTIIGILPFERVKKQKVIIDINFQYKFNKNSKEFIDYSEISFLVKNIMNKKQYKLIEEAILDISKIVLKKYKKILNFNIKITKPNIMKNCLVSVSNNI